VRQHAHRYAASVRLTNRGQTQCRTWRERFQQNAPRFIQRGDGHVHANGVPLCNLSKQSRVARDQIRLSRDADLDASLPAITSSIFE